jgi:thiamine biosynthesis protein ThiS
MEVIVNGETRQTEDGATVSTLLKQLALDPARVAVELDRLIVKAPEWPEKRLQEGSRIEIVQFVGGG